VSGKGEMETGMRRSGGAVLLAALALAAAGSALAVGASSAQAPGDGKQPVQVESDKLEALRAEGRSIYTGHVVVVDGKSRLTADKLTVICDQPAQPAPKSKSPSGASDCSDIKQLIAESNVLYVLDDDKIRGDRAEYDYGTGVITVTGSPGAPVVLSRADKGVISGPKLVYNTNKGLAQMVGIKTGDRVSSVFVPKDNNASTPPAPGQSTAPAPSTPTPSSPR
jgi:lipopolysaccharide export system protein LptA